MGMVAASVVVVALPSAAQTAQEPLLDIGVVQRFGSEPNAKMTLKPIPGDRLTLQFTTGDQPQTVTTTQDVKVEVTLQPLPEPKVVEKVILSTHRSFESAEDSANRWRQQGIEVEVGQPQQWQVWAKRDVYRSPLMRRLLMQNLQSNGSTSAFLDTKVLSQVPKTSFIVNGYRYQRDELNILSNRRQINVTLGDDTSTQRLYAGTLKLQPNAYGTYTLVNRVPLETYLRGVVPHEIGLAAPRTTIEAQAILARTYVMRNLRRFAIDNYQLCADTQCQVYKGLDGAAPASDRAIAATRNQVLTYQNELVDALYSSTTGGITASFTDVWNGADRPYLRAVVDSVYSIWDLSRFSLADERNLRAFINRTEGFNEQGWDVFRWRKESTLENIAQGLRQYLGNRRHPMANLTQVTGMQVIERSPAGRVRKLEIQTDKGRLVLEKDEILRALYAPTSTLFYLEPMYEEVLPPASPSAMTTEDASPSGAPTSAPATPTQVLKGYTFVGGGLGHGVGMSQTGAYRLGELGWSSERILSFYYPGTQLQPLNPNIVYWRDPLDESTNQASKSMQSEHQGGTPKADPLQKHF